MELANLTQEQIYEARDTLFDYLDALFYARWELESLWEICSENPNRKSEDDEIWKVILSKAWLTFSLLNREDVGSPRPISFNEYENSTAALLASLENKQLAVAQSDNGNLRAALEMASVNLTCGEVILKQRRILKVPATPQEMEVEDRQTNGRHTTYFYSVIEERFEWHERIYVRKQEEIRRVLPMEKRIEAISNFFESFDSHYQLLDDEPRKRITNECAKAAQLAMDCGRRENDSCALVNEERDSGASQEIQNTSLPTVDANNENVFREKGGGFDVTFEGENYVLRSTNGAKAIHYLLDRPGKWCSASDIYIATNPPHPTGQEHFHDSYDDHGLTETSSEMRLEHTDQRTLDAVHSELDDIKERLALTNDISERIELEDEGKKIQCYIDSCSAIDGKTRASLRRDQKNAKCTAENIRNFKKSLRDHHPSLAEYLNQSIIHKNRDFFYMPDSAVRWDT